MYMICTNNDGFEDQLTVGKQYPVKALKGASVQVENDNGVNYWYGTTKFGHEGNK